jgi:hypothetical protein
MTSKQKLLEKYIQKYISPSQQTKTQIPLHTQFLQKWLEKISQPLPLEIQQQQQQKTKNQKPKTPSMYDLIPSTILKKEIPKLDQHTNITFTSHGRPISIFFSHTHANIPSPTFIQRCIQVIHTLSEFAPKHCLQSPINIYIYLTHAQKTIRHSEDVVPPPPITIGEENVNTAFTTSCDPLHTTPHPKEIILFRQEEVFKVLIHELFHVLGMDFSNNHSQTQQTSQMLREYLNINLPDLRLFETYTETWACILNIICLSVWDNQSQTESKNLQTQIQSRFQKERNFSLWQASKVIHYNQTSHAYLNKKCLKPSSCFVSQTNQKQHQKTQHQKTQHQKTQHQKTQHQKTQHQKNTKNKTQKQNPNKREYKENTQVFCYFLLKAAVFQKIDMFVTKFPPPFNQYHDEENQYHHAQVFTQFVLEAFQETNFANKLQKMSAIYIKYFHTHPRKEQWMFDTMRQTVNEIDILS